MSVLKACPFCGADKVGIEYDDDMKMHFVKCRHCNAHGPMRENVNFCVIQWNKRIEHITTMLRTLCGYVEDGTEQVVTIFQDDATKEWSVKIQQGNLRLRQFHGDTFTAAISAAFKDATVD